MKNVLITGICGMTGSYLAEYILENHSDWIVHGTYRYRSDTENIAAIERKIKLHDCELRDSHNVYEVIREIKPDKVFHLAATSFVRYSFNQPADIIYNNTIGQINILEAIRKLSHDCVVQIAGTSEEYGEVHQEEIPIKETNPLRPLSPYGVSKVAQEQLAFQYHRSYGLNTIVTRTFNHTSPRRTASFVESNFCKQVAEIEAGLREPVIRHGNLNSVRDYTDARDVARAYWLATEKCDAGDVYNICSESYVTISQVLDMILGHSDTEIKKQIDEKRLRPSDVVLLYGDCKKFKKKTGWEPKIKLEHTLKELLDTWRFKTELKKQYINRNG